MGVWNYVKSFGKFLHSALSKVWERLKSLNYEHIDADLLWGFSGKKSSKSFFEELRKVDEEFEKLLWG